MRLGERGSIDCTHTGGMSSRHGAEEWMQCLERTGDLCLMEGGGGTGQKISARDMMATECCKELVLYWT